MRSLDDVESLCVIRGCRELENYFGTNFTDTVLFDANAVCLRTIKKTIHKIDKEKLVLKCHKKSPTIASHQ